MNRFYAAIVVSALSSSLGHEAWAQSQPSPADTGRHILVKVQPKYPAAALRMSIGGTVKVTALVEPDGSVKKVEPVGGNPILIEAASNAVAQWKYSAGGESRESVELHFRP